MTLKELESKVTIGVCLQGHFKVAIEYRGKTYYSTSTDTMLYDVIRYGSENGYTRKQAYQSLYDDCKLKNNI